MPTTARAASLQALNAEFEDFHGFINEWFRGECPERKELFEWRYASHLAEGFQIILPDGSVLDRDGLIGLIRDLFGKNPCSKKQIRNMQLRPIECKDYSLVNYEEWLKCAANFAPPNHARQVSAVVGVVSGDPVRFEWLQIHESTMPEQATASDPLEF